MRLVIGTRGSLLALWQAEHIRDEIKKLNDGAEVELKIIKTTGDKILDTPLAKIGGKGLFTKEIEEAMLSQEVDIAVHSLKDVPVEFMPSLGLSAITKRDDSRDAFLSEHYKSLDELPSGAIIGTTSLRRRMQILAYRSDLTIKNLRGNLQSRIEKLKRGEYDMIILAYAGIKRLGLQNVVKYVEPVSKDILVPPMGQAALGIECRIDSEAFKLTTKLNDSDALIECGIEREFVRELEGGCQAPIGINAQIEGEEILLRALVGLPDGSKFIKKEKRIKKSEYVGFGAKLAQEFKNEGALELIREAIEQADKILG